MPYKCQALFCKNYYKKGANISFFKFPRNKEVFQKWVNACCKSSLLELYDTTLQKVKKKITLCEKHFYETDIIRNDTKKMLKQGAIPREELVVLKIKEKNRCPKENFDHNKQNYVSIQEDLENSEKNFCEIILEKIPETNINTQHMSDEEIIVSVLSEDSFESNETVLIEISEDKIPTVSFPIEESSIHDIEERISNQPNIQEATVTDTILAKCKEETPGYNTATPKKKKLRLQLKRLRSRHSKLVKKLNYPTKNINTKNVLQFCKGKLSKQGYDLLKIQLNSKKRLTYSSQEKSLAMSMYYAGPKLYRDLRTYLKLPAPSTLRSWVGSVKLEPGICNDMFSLLKAKAQNLNIDERVCVLYLDEMSLKTNLEMLLWQ
ncbi:UNVERIFIED_CONTAM: hypothetical protein RMT77_016765 [Armadillidium vulgare]